MRIFVIFICYNCTLIAEFRLCLYFCSLRKPFLLPIKLQFWVLFYPSISHLNSPLKTLLINRSDWLLRYQTTDTFDQFANQFIPNFNIAKCFLRVLSCPPKICLAGIMSYSEKLILTQIWIHTPTLSYKQRWGCY